MNSTLGKTSVGLALLALCISSVPAAHADKIIIPPLEKTKIYCAPVKVEAKCAPQTVESKVTIEKPVASLKSKETITETISESSSSAPKRKFRRASFKHRKVAHRHTMKRRVARRPMTKVVTQLVRVERTKVVEKIVEKPVYIDRVVEKPVYIEKCVEKPVYIDRIVERQVQIEQPVVIKKRSHFIRLGTPLFSIGVL